jgi:putative transposase
VEDTKKFRKNIRLKGYNYSSDGYYFVTICTYNRKKLFVDAASYAAKKNSGDNRTLKAIVEDKINQIEKYYSGVRVDYYIIMPDHIHMIIVLEGADVSLSKIINAFKSWVTREIKKMGGLSAQGFFDKSAQGAENTNMNRYVWQPNYYEHVIRDEKALEKIREYVIYNPEKDKINFEQFYETNKKL